MKIGFDHGKYLEEQSKYILERVNKHDKLYIEFGGKLLGDLHAKRVLPGFDENAKIKVLNKLKDQIEVIICVYAGDIERNKIRGDFGITYDMDVFRLIDDLRENELRVNSVVITRYEDRPSTDLFITRLERRGIKVYKHYATKGYPSDVDTIVSDEGYGKNAYIETTKPIVVVTAPGPGSGKLATCLSQLYHEYKRGRNVGYSKFETFPVWNVPLKHPLNIAYEAATADLKDVNMIDPFHLEAYGVTAINYNRDIEAFPVLKRILDKITGDASVYQSPTDMGVNRAGFGIIDDDICREAAKQEIIRRYLLAEVAYKKGKIDESVLERTKLLMEEVGATRYDRKVVAPAEEYAEMKRAENERYENVIVAAIELPDGRIVTGRSSHRMAASAAMILNAIKTLAGLADDIPVISAQVLENLQKMNVEFFGDKSSLNCEEIIMALTMSTMTNPTADYALKELYKLRGCRAHSTAILSDRDEQTLKSLGIDMTSNPEFSTSDLYSK